METSQDFHLLTVLVDATGGEPLTGSFFETEKPGSDFSSSEFGGEE